MKEYTLDLDGKVLSFTIGKFARQANGAVMGRMGDTMVLSSACMSETVQPGQDFFPLTVDYREKAYAAGKIPGGFFKREGRPTTDEILRARIVDRSIRPFFPAEFRNEVQILIGVYSFDRETSVDPLSVNSSSLALAISKIPFGGPVGACYVGEVDGRLILDPTLPEMERARFFVLVVGTTERICMIEAEGREAEESRMLEAISLGHERVKKICSFISSIAAEIGVEKVPVPVEPVDESLEKELENIFVPACMEALTNHDKLARREALEKLREKTVAHFQEKFSREIELEEDRNARLKQVKSLMEKLISAQVRKLALERGERVDGRGMDELREISVETNILPRTHGSALFTRGQTQSLSSVTLGSPRDEQIIDGLEESKKRFMLHYNFPPFATGEVKPLRGVGRREIGHGALAEKALQPIIPKEDEFPYTIRVVSDILESNGSSSMASVCAGSLALHDAGVPVLKHVAGISTGLIDEGDRWCLLTDIAGIEDHCGDMDFKVAGTREGITAIQLDVKNSGLTLEMIEKTLETAKRARLKILDEMEKHIAKPRPELSPYAPRIFTLWVPPDKIREVIGTGGKVVRGIVDATGCEIDIEDSGKINIIATDATKAAEARKMIEGIVKEPEVGETYKGKVTRIMNFGAFVEILPGKEGLVHISELDFQRVKAVEDVVKIGDEVTVKVIEIDSMNRINLSRKAAMTRSENTGGGSEGNGRGERGGQRVERGRHDGGPGGKNYGNRDSRNPGRGDR